jgi:hypothetical protein
MQVHRQEKLANLAAFCYRQPSDGADPATHIRNDFLPVIGVDSEQPWLVTVYGYLDQRGNIMDMQKSKFFVALRLTFGRVCASRE